MLAELARGELTETEAYAWLDGVMEASVLPKSLELVEMSPAEWSAFTRGLPLGVLARWRDEGWPAECAACGDEVAIDALEWRIVRDGGDVTGFALVHVGCP